MRPDDAIRNANDRGRETCLRFVDGRWRRDLDVDLMLRFALVRAIEIIGEAASSVGLETRAAASSVPWPAIIATRNRLIDAYFDIENDVLWKTATEEVRRFFPRFERHSLTHEVWHEVCARIIKGGGPFVGPAAPSSKNKRVSRKSSRVCQTEPDLFNPFRRSEACEIAGRIDRGRSFTQFEVELRRIHVACRRTSR